MATDKTGQRQVEVVQEEIMQVKATKDGIRLTDTNDHGIIEWIKELKPIEALKLKRDISNALFDYKNLTGRSIDEPACY